MLHEIRLDAPVYLVIATYVAISLSYLRQVGPVDASTIGAYSRSWLFVFAFVLPSIATGIGAIRIVQRLQERRLLAIRLMFSVRRTSRFLAGIILLVAIGPFITIFTSVKMALPAQSGFVWDRALADFDRAISFGVDPWILLHRILPADRFLSIVEFNYNVGWFLACWIPCFWIATSPKASKMRSRFAVCFLLVWAVLGSALAGVFISAGPIFYDAVTGDSDRFAGLMSQLARNAEIPTSVFSYQLYLWEAYETGNAKMGTGISAFPSVHVGLITMCALFVREQSRWLGRAAFAYVTIILLSSVYLGWHYASDGYAAIVVVLIIYWLVRLVPFDRLVPPPFAYRPAASAAG